MKTLPTVKMWMLTLLLISSQALFAIDADEILDYGDAFAISGQALDADHIEVVWQIAPDHYLYHNRFLRFQTNTPGVTLGDTEIPEGKRSFDELLGEEVIKFHGELRVTVPLASVAPGTQSVALQIRSQGCLEAVLCYPPTVQELVIDLPVDTTTAAQPIPGASSLSGALDAALNNNPLGSVGQAPVQDALPPEQAFVYEAIALSSETLLVRFTPEPGYYLYRDKFSFRLPEQPEISIREVNLPDGQIKDDPEFGEVEVYFDQVEIKVRLNRPAGPEQTIQLAADFQGCRDGDICYPPMKRSVSLSLPGASEPIMPPSLLDLDSQGSQSSTATTGSSTENLPPVSEQDRLARLLVDSPAKALIAFFIAGILLAFTPCVFPMVPILSGIIAGAGDNITTRRAFTLSLVYVLAMAATYTVVGVLAGMFGKNLQAVFQNPWIISAFVALFIALALSMFGFYELQLPNRWQSRLTEMSNRQQGGNLWGVAVMGLLSALIVGPCVAPPLAAALIVIGSTGSPALGGGALFALGLGMGVPLILFGISAGKFLPKAGAWMNAVKGFFGVGLLALSIWLLERILPGGLVMVLWGILAIASAVYMGATDAAGESGWSKLWKSIGIVLLVFGILQLVGAAAGGNNWMQPLAGLKSASHQEASNHVAFRKIKSLDDLNQALISNGGKISMLDFYADWCAECIHMERTTFQDSDVYQVSQRLQVLQADVTEYDEIDQALMKHFSIIGPPMILFFDAQGNEMAAYRLVGYFGPEEFIQHLEQVLAAR